MGARDNNSDEFVRTINGGRIGYCSGAGRYQNLADGTFVSGAKFRELIENISLSRALKIGEVFYKARTNAK